MKILNRINHPHESIRRVCFSSIFNLLMILSTLLMGCSKNSLGTFNNKNESTQENQNDFEKSKEDNCNQNSFSTFLGGECHDSYKFNFISPLFYKLKDENVISILLNIFKNGEWERFKKGMTTNSSKLIFIPTTGKELVLDSILFFNKKSVDLGNSILNDSSISLLSIESKNRSCYHKLREEFYQKFLSLHEDLQNFEQILCHQDFLDYLYYVLESKSGDYPTEIILKGRQFYLSKKESNIDRITLLSQFSKELKDSCGERFNQPYSLNDCIVNFEKVGGDFKSYLLCIAKRENIDLDLSLISEDFTKSEKDKKSFGKIDFTITYLRNNEDRQFPFSEFLWNEEIEANKMGPAPIDLERSVNRKRKKVIADEGKLFVGEVKIKDCQMINLKGEPRNWVDCNEDVIKRIQLKEFYLSDHEREIIIQNRNFLKVKMNLSIQQLPIESVLPNLQKYKETKSLISKETTFLLPTVRENVVSAMATFQLYSKENEIILFNPFVDQDLNLIQIKDIKTISPPPSRTEVITKELQTLVTCQVK